MGLFYSNIANNELFGYVNARYLFDSFKGWSQIGYLFTCNDTDIS